MMGFKTFYQAGLNLGRLWRVGAALICIAAVGVATAGCDDPPVTADVAEDVPQTDASTDVDGGSDVAADIADTGSKLGIDYSTTDPGVTPRYEPAASDWMAMGWPNDRYRRADGGPDLLRFPNIEQRELLKTYLQHGQQVLDGWGLNGSVYFQMGGDLNPATMPSAELTLNDPKAPIQMINVSAESSRYGERMPLLFRWFDDSPDEFWLPKTLAMRPVFGFPRAEGETYCAVITRAVKDAEGNYLGRSTAFSDALDTDPTLAPLVAWLNDPAQTGIGPNDVAVASCFTGQNATAELRKVQQFLETQPLPVMNDIEYLGSAQYHHEFRGHYTAPNFQAGAKPYVEDGDLRFDASGAPIIQASEEIRFLLMVPKPSPFPMPDEGYPVVTYAHGTGGTYDSCKTSSGPPLVKEGVAVICIDQPLHGERGPGGIELSQTALILYSFNFQNARAGRMSFRQSAIDTMSLTRMVVGGGFDLDSTETAGTPFDAGIKFNSESVLFFGHSHGGLSGALAFGVDPELSAGVLSGAGGILIETILRRKDPDVGAIAKLALNVRDENFDSFHPALSLVQMLVDATDPVNYAPYWFNPAPGGTPKHMFVTEGTLDHATPGVATEAMCSAAGIPLAKPVAQASLPHDLRGLPTLSFPVTGNIDTPDGPRTAALRQWLDADHWVALNDDLAAKYWTKFFRTIRKGQVATIGE